MKNWKEVAKLVSYAEKSGLSLDQFITLLRWEWVDKPIKNSLQAPGRKRPPMSAAARKKISDAQKLRWSKVKKH